MNSMQRKMMVVGLVAVMLTGTLFATGAGDAVSANTKPQLLTGILAKMEKMHRELRSLKANIVQAKTNAQIGSTDKEYGALVYKPASGKGKGKLRIDYTKPSNNVVAVTGDAIVFYQPKINQAFKNSLAKAAKGRAGSYGQIVGLDGSVKSLLDNYNIEYVKDEDVDGQSSSHLRLLPKAASSVASIEIWVNNQTGFPAMQKFNERNGDYTVIKLTSIQQNVAVNDAEFEVKLPSGTKVVDKI